jgi:hypothetical protein
MTTRAALCWRWHVTAVSLHAQWLRIPTPAFLVCQRPSGSRGAGARARRRTADRWRAVEAGAARAHRRHRAGLAPASRFRISRGPRAVTKERAANLAKDDPTSNCIVGGVPRSDFVPYPFKILEMPGWWSILYEAIHSYRQIFTDGAQLPKDPSPAWFGYSVGKWEGRRVRGGQRGLQRQRVARQRRAAGRESLRVTERFIRRDFGHMDIEITIDDPKTYTRPWKVTQPLVYQPDDELIEYICDENNRYFLIVPSAEPPGRPKK